MRSPILRKIVFTVVAAAFLAVTAITAAGTPDIAHRTDKKCAACHDKSDSGGGGGGPHELGPGGPRNK